MIEINGKKYRNIQEQVKENMDDIAEIKAAMPYPSNEYYTKTESDTRYPTRNGDNEFRGVNQFVETYIGKSHIDDDDVNLRAQVTGSEDYTKVSLDPNSIIIEAVNEDEDEATIGISATEINLNAARVRVNGGIVHNVYKHDIMLLLADTNDTYAAAHLVIIDSYSGAYTLSKILTDWRGNMYPITYSRKSGIDVLNNLGHTRVFINFSLEDSNLWFEENESMFSGEAVVTETVNSYKILAINDTVTLL